MTILACFYIFFKKILEKSTNQVDIWWTTEIYNDVVD